VSGRALIEGRPALAVIMGTDQRSAPLPSLVAAARGANVPVLWVLPAGAEPTIECPPKAGECVICARRHSIFYGTDLAIVLGDLGVRTLILAGGVTSVAVHYSFVDAHQNDYFCRVAEDCMTGSSPAAHEAALRAMEYMQTGARRRAADFVDGLRMRLRA
jgi:Isochorismatase family